MKDNIGAIQKVVERINNNPEELPSAVEASRSVGYERSYLSKLFRQVTGTTFNAYSNIIKMGFAAVQLRDTEMTVSEIALRLGYSGQDAFTHAFTNVYRCSPTEYRKNPDIISVPFFKIINIENKGVMTMKKIDPANIIGDGFLQLLELQPASIIMYCFWQVLLFRRQVCYATIIPQGTNFPVLASIHPWQKCFLYQWTRYLEALSN